MSKRKKLFYIFGLATIMPASFATILSCGVSVFVNKTVNTDDYKFPPSIEFTGPGNGQGQIKDIEDFKIPANTQLLYQVNNGGFQAKAPTNLRLFDILDVKIVGKPNYVITKDQSHQYKVESGFGNILSNSNQLSQFTTFSSGVLTINSNVDEIQTGVFDLGTYGHGGSKISSIVFARDSQISIINENAFQQCSIMKLDIPSSLEYIGDNAFQKAALTTLNINADSKLISIGDNAFESSTLEASKSLVIPNNVTTIGVGAFQNAALSSLSFPGTLLRLIGDNAFSSLKVIGLTIPYSVQNIGNSAFKNVALETLTFQFTNDNPSRLQSIGADAFSSSLLKTLIIPSSVQEIQERAFLESIITNLTFLGDIPSKDGRQLTLGEESFSKTKLSAIQNGDHTKEEWLNWLKTQALAFDPNK